MPKNLILQKTKKIFAPVPILILDMDGVLNSDHSLYLQGPHVLRGSPGGASPWHVCLLNKICEETGARVVLSSIWRNGHTAAEMMRFFKQSLKSAESLWPAEDLGWKNPHTKCHIRFFTLPKGVKKPCDVLSSPWKTPCISINRGVEIAQWLKDYGEYVTRYVIIDDEGGMLPEQMPFFVKVDMRDGLGFKAHQQAINVLQGKPLSSSFDEIDIGFSFSNSEDKKAVGEALTRLQQEFQYKKWNDADFAEKILGAPVRTFQAWKRGDVLPNKQARILLDVLRQDRFEMPHLLAKAMHS